MELGKQIRRYRNERSFSQEALAEKYTFLDRQYRIGKTAKAIPMSTVSFYSVKHLKSPWTN